jgi:hypothetical protein
MAVFPTLGHQGNSYETSVKRIRRRYDDGSQRSYTKSTFKHRVLSIKIVRVSQAVRNTIATFVEARLVDNAEFHVYNPQETFVLDLTGAATTGRHTCDEIMGDTVNWTMEGNCRYSTEISFFLKD